MKSSSHPTHRHVLMLTNAILDRAINTDGVVAWSVAMLHHTSTDGGLKPTRAMSVLRYAFVQIY